MFVVLKFIWMYEADTTFYLVFNISPDVSLNFIVIEALCLQMHLNSLINLTSNFLCTVDSAIN